MTAPQENQEAQAQSQEQPVSNKEMNFRALENKMLQAQRRAEEAEKRAQEAERIAQETVARKQKEQEDPDDDSSEPYVDHKRLSRQFSAFEKKMEDKIDKKAEEKARRMYEEGRRNDWLRNNPDFYEVLQHADEFAKRDPELAEAILEMPEGFERQKLVYKNIKALGVHKPKQPEPSIQQKVDANKRSPYYQPSGVPTAPYGIANAGKDYSAVEQKSAYQKMQELKSKLRI